MIAQRQFSVGEFARAAPQWRRGGRVRSEADGPESLSVPSVSGPSRWSDPATQPSNLRRVQVVAPTRSGRAESDRVAGAHPLRGSPRSNAFHFGGFCKASAPQPPNPEKKIWVILTPPYIEKDDCPATAVARFDPVGQRLPCYVGLLI